MKFSKKEIEINNKLIAEFISIKNKNDLGYHGLYFNHPKISWAGIFYKEYEFHSSWDWLMPVVNHIECMFEIDKSISKLNINSYCVSFYLPTMGTICAGCYKKSKEEIKFSSKIEAVYYVVVEFIKWYNKTYK